MSGRRRLLAPIGILLGGVVAVALMVATRERVEPEAPKPNVPLVRASRVEPRPVTFRVRAQGTVGPRTESELVPQVAGEVVWVSPTLVSGGFFEAGEPLVRIESTDYDVALETARAAVARAESEHVRARKERERQQRLAEQFVASEARIDDAENGLRVAAAQLREAKAKLQRAERDLARTELRAPYDGRVRDERVDVGQFVNRGTSIATLYAVDYAEVRLPIPDRQLAYLDLSLGHHAASEGEAPAVILRAEFAGQRHEWHGRIVRTEGEIDPRSRMVNAVARVEDPYGRLAGKTGAPLAVGLFVEAEIEGLTLPAAVVLPRTALREDDRVLVIDADGRLEHRAVEVLRAEREEVVVGSGLRAGEQVCISPLGAVVDGMQVRIAEEGDALVGAAP